MNLYSTKKRWKYVLFIVGFLIIVFSLLYTNYIVKKISNDERRRVELWAEGIQQKARLVNYTRDLFLKLEYEEEKKVKLWSDATQLLADPYVNMDLTFLLDVAKNNTTVPVILTDDSGNIISHRNLDSDKSGDPKWLKEQLEIMKQQRSPIEVRYDGNRKNYLYYKDSRLFSEIKLVMDDLIRSFISEIVINSASVPVIYYDIAADSIIDFGNIDPKLMKDPVRARAKMNQMKDVNRPIEVRLSREQANYIYYDNSFILKQLKYYPYVQLFFIGLFILFAYWLFSSYRRAEQNQVWAGMAKETAHQLGTPISSLLAWMEILKGKRMDQSILTEINKDVVRLQTVADRFSKIGSASELKEVSLIDVLGQSIDYLKKRSAKSIKYSYQYPGDHEIRIRMNQTLFEWVVENLLKNAIDSMEGRGEINVKIILGSTGVNIDISDTGKGIPQRDYKTIFEPGFTTKRRGWGLGLSLTKRIIEQYHSGKIFVKESEVGKGTTFRIFLPY